MLEERRQRLIEATSTLEAEERILASRKEALEQAAPSFAELFDKNCESHELDHELETQIRNNIEKSIIIETIPLLRWRVNLNPEKFKK